MAGMRRILVAVKDLKGKTLPAVLKAAQIARACGAQLEVFHSLSSPLYVDFKAIGRRGLDGIEEAQRQQALRRLEAIAYRLRRHSIRVGVSAVWDFPAYEAIIRRAQEIKADLIVVARHEGRHTMPWLMRLTDWELVRLSPIPLLLVKDTHAYRHPAVLAAIDPSQAAGTRRQHFAGRRDDRQSDARDPARRSRLRAAAALDDAHGGTDTGIGGIDAAGSGAFGTQALRSRAYHRARGARAPLSGAAPSGRRHPARRAPMRSRHRRDGGHVALRCRPFADRQHRRAHPR